MLIFFWTFWTYYFIHSSFILSPNLIICLLGDIRLNHAQKISSFANLNSKICCCLIRRKLCEQITDLKKKTVDKNIDLETPRSHEL